MSKRKMIAGSLLALVMVLSCMMFGMTSVAFADDYQYTVTLSGGAQGTVSGSTELSYNLGDTWDETTYHEVVEAKAPYYFKGWHIAGQDEIIWANQKITVDKDFDLVATYGIANDDIVAYTATFTDAAGNELHASQTFYGKIGDKPVVSYLYVEGYTPQAYNLTKTLVADESQNVFPFVYDEGSADNGGSTTGGEGTEEGGATTGGGTAAGGTAAGGAAGDGGAAAGGAGADDGAAAIDDDATPQANPDDVVDLDDDETPLAPGEEGQDGEEKKGGLGAGLYLGIGIGIAAIIAAIAALLRRRGNDEAAGE